MSRFFNPRQRQALWIIANGRCQMCDIELQTDWHADHVIPHSKGGPTDVINGQALCPPCNVKKGNQMFDDLRPWQRKALKRIDALAENGKRGYSVEACPGAGKTRLAIAVAQQQQLSIVHVVPSSSLVDQAIDAYAKAGIALRDATNIQGNGPWRSDVDGIACTYQKLASDGGELMRTLINDVPTIVILDEIHHAGDEASWGKAVIHACQAAQSILVLSGTPWRSDDTRIPFMNYEYDGTLISDYKYDFATAWADTPSPIRLVTFNVFNATGKIAYQSDDSFTYREGDIKDTKVGSKDFSWVYRNVRNGEGGQAMLEMAIKDLNARRKTRRDAKGIILAANIRAADKLAENMNKMGQRSVVVHGEKKDAHRIIKNFPESSNHWIIGVGMLGEGIDIPSAEVLIRLDSITTELFFVQSIGRVIRRVAHDDPPASVYMFAVDEMVSYAEELDKNRPRVLKDFVERQPGEWDGGGCGGPGESFTFVDLGSDNASQTMLLMHGEDLLEPVSSISELLEAAGHEHLIPHAPVIAQLFGSPSVQMPSTNVMTKVDPKHRARLQQDVTDRCDDLRRLLNVDYWVVPQQVNDLFGKANKCTCERNPHTSKCAKKYGSTLWSNSQLEDAKSWLDHELSRPR